MNQLDNIILAVESLIDIEKLKNEILNTYSRDTNNESVIVKDKATVDLQFTYEDVGKITQNKCLEEINFFSTQITRILETCKHEHNLTSLHQTTTMLY